MRLSLLRVKLRIMVRAVQRNKYLNSRDHKILEHVLKNKVTSCKTLHESPDFKCSMRTLTRSLTKLIASGHIVKDFVPNKNMRSATVYYLSTKGLNEIYPHFKDFKNVKLKSDKIQHDFTICKVRQVVGKLKNVKKVWSENEIKISTNFEYNEALAELDKENSDSALSLEWNGEEIHLALEYEASLKSKQRIREKLISYYRHSKINAVLYVCKNESIKSTFMKIEKSFNTSNQQKIYYITLDELLSNPNDPTFISITGEELGVFS